MRNCVCNFHIYFFWFTAIKGGENTHQDRVRILKKNNDYQKVNLKPLNKALFQQNGLDNDN